MGDIIDGKAVAATVTAEVARRVEGIVAQGVRPGLAVVVVGDHEPSRIYVRHKMRGCERVGIRSAVHALPASVTQEEVLAVVERLNADPEVHGILVQLPLPPGLGTRTILHAIDPHKDVDGFHPVNMGQVATGRPPLAPCTPKGVMRLLREYEVPIRGAHAVVVGRSRVVGRPMAALLLAADATVTICHRHTDDTAAHTARADILVVAVGVPELVRGSWVREGAVVIDVGISRSSSGRLVGDVCFAEVQPRARLITPVPGGVGPMTIAMLLENTCVLAERLRGLPPWPPLGSPA
ncbi:MAG: bifunctional methylenetetrahydrofolate dehydrogenase/methenyltetrahydrofolate cyclohydrolase FolD [Deltaproteobacteria bacterium]|nr:bifunctional methylenetetrahydrofolate dehydrogenase/methenyltetrahydrofolate cyclohydrolase FolD [Deltaproteobacteria bacterium]MCB9786985.1 bifunctional methylenetetrahydrofolate dehydrogenase/methenyltetrahydrofolate cyclohydrolase FolD [Deltaproteobacteria bacterium]